MLGDVRCVNAQDSDRVGAPVGQLDDDGVAVERFDPTRPGPRGTSLITEPPSADAAATTISGTTARTGTTACPNTAVRP